MPKMRTAPLACEGLVLRLVHVMDLVQPCHPSSACLPPVRIAAAGAATAKRLERKPLELLEAVAYKLTNASQ
eukprot:4718878-Pleurochrysis_carterae.AAC.1